MAIEFKSEYERDQKWKNDICKARTLVKAVGEIIDVLSTLDRDTAIKVMPEVRDKYCLIREKDNYL